MPLFPNRRTRMQDIPGVVPYKGDGGLIFDPPPTQRRRGLFGGMARGIQDTVTGREDRDPNVLDFILRGPNGVDRMRDRRFARDMFGNEIRQQKIEDARSEQERIASEQEAAREAAERQQLEAMIATLPPDQQMLARLNPQAFVGGMMRHRYPAPQRWMNDPGESEGDDGWSYED